MFDHKNNNQEFDDSKINLLPKKANQEKAKEVKAAKQEPLPVHEPAKDNFSQSRNPKLVAPEPVRSGQPKPSFFGKFRGLLGFSNQPSVPPILNISANQPAKLVKKEIPAPSAPTEYVPPVSLAPKPASPVDRKVPPVSDSKNDLEVNLLPKTKKHLTDSQIIFSYFFIFIICLLVIFTPYIYYKGKNKGYINDNEILKNQLSLIDSRLQDMQGRIQDYGQFSLQLKNLAQVLNSHIYWSLFFPTLEQHTVGDVYFTSLSLGEDRKVGLEGSGLNLRSLAEQLIVMEQSKTYTNFKLQSLSFVEPKEPNSPTIKFSISFTAPESVSLSNGTTADHAEQSL
ncbi:MAG TPA: hypothetical protein PLR18_02670 [bacterium]|nr:hypothetical protein [bacterium]